MIWESSRDGGENFTPQTEMIGLQKTLFEKEELKMSKGKWMAKIGILLFAVFTLTVFVAAQLWAAPVTIKFATGMPPDEEEALHRGAVVFKKFIEQKAPGRLKGE